MDCPPVRGDNPRALASGLSNVQADNPWYCYFFIPPYFFMLPLEHYTAILLICIKRKSALKTIFGLFESGRFTQILLYCITCPTNIGSFLTYAMYHHRERSGSVVEFLTRDREVAGSSLIGVTELCH